MNFKFLFLLIIFKGTSLLKILISFRDQPFSFSQKLIFKDYYHNEKESHVHFVCNVLNEIDQKIVKELRKNERLYGKNTVSFPSK